MDSVLSKDLVPSDAGEKLLANWPAILVIGLLGGLLGFGCGYLTPPTYLATASLGIGADPNLAEPLNPNVQVEANLRIQDLLLSDATLQEARSFLSADEAGKDLGDFRSLIRLEQYDTRWDLEVTGRTPQVAADGANAWAKAAQDQFARASAHAINAGKLQALLFSVACQPEVLVQGGTSNLWACDETNLGIDPSEVSADLLEEARLSQGILPALSLSELEAATPPERPLRQSVPVLGLIGALAGVVLGLAVVGGGVWPRAG